MPGKVVQLVAVGSIPNQLLKDLEEPLQTQLGIQPVQGRVPLTDPKYAFNKDRNQYHSQAIMRRLVPLLGPGQIGLGMCEVDLFVPDSPFVFGEADRESRIAIVSLHRLRQGAEGEMLRRRVQVESVHQAGHLVGLSYCEDPRCVMFLATQTSDVDRKNVTLCNVCRNELSKLSR